MLIEQLNNKLWYVGLGSNKSLWISYAYVIFMPGRAKSDKAAVTCERFCYSVTSINYRYKYTLWLSGPTEQHCEVFIAQNEVVFGGNNLRSPKSTQHAIKTE